LEGQIIPDPATVKNDRLTAAYLRVASEDLFPSLSFLVPKVDGDDDDVDEDDE